MQTQGVNEEKGKESDWIKVDYKGIEQNWLRTNRCYRINTIHKN